MHESVLTTTRKTLLAATAGLALVASFAQAQDEAKAGPASPDTSRDAIVEVMKRATTFMREQCTVNGGYVWAYAKDFSRRWGEMEAYPSMIWIQPPGTATVGHLYLDAYHVTGDEYFYEAAAEVAGSLIAAQHEAGGWNYLHDFAGEASIKRWYDTIGKNGWRLEEFHHYYGNATFDDAGTAEASQFLLRMYLEKRDQAYAPALEKSLRFVLDSQYDNGGWPQRFPFVEDAPALHGRPDYTRYVTFNDDVARQNITFLLMVWQTLGDQRALDAIHSAMNVLPASQQPAPQAGWGLQHTVDTLEPIGARSYEPNSLVTSTTAANVSMMLDFYEWTGEKRFLERLPEAFAWLESVQLPEGEEPVPGRRFPTFIEIGSNRALINHRRGSNVVNGEYYQDYSTVKPIAHYSQWRSIDLDGLKTRYEQVSAIAPEAARAASPLSKQENFRLPPLFTNRNIEVSDLNSNAGSGAVETPDEAAVATLLSSLNDKDYWPTPLTATSHPYSGDGPETPAEGDFSGTHVGDASDTSPYVTDTPKTGISTGKFIQNMSALIQVLSH